MSIDPADPTGTSFRTQIDARMDGFWDELRQRLAGVWPDLPMLVDVASRLAAAGKRLRPAFGYWGYVSVCDDGELPDGFWRALAGFELLHVAALVHDDVLDAADTRRGLPAAHRQFETRYREQGGDGDAAGFGRAMAVLLGDELLVWSGELVEDSGLPAARWRRAARYWHLVRSEVNAGQVLDMMAQFRLGADDRALAEAVLVEKTARYTVQRPVQFGAAVAGADEHVLAGLGRYGLALGRAYQLRDDLLGVFGDEQVTGKPAGGDLREGKRTVLVAAALTGLDEHGATELAALLGLPDLDDGQIAHARRLITDSGAVAEVEDAITAHHQQALDELAALDLTPRGRAALVRLAELGVRRDR